MLEVEEVLVEDVLDVDDVLDVEAVDDVDVEAVAVAAVVVPPLPPPAQPIMRAPSATVRVAPTRVVFDLPMILYRQNSARVVLTMTPRPPVPVQCA